MVILKAGPNLERPGTEKVAWEHRRRNFALRADGSLLIVCPISDWSDVKGVGIFNAEVTETKETIDEDPGVKEGMLVYEAHAGRSIPGYSLR